MRKLFLSAALLGASALPLFAATQSQASTGCTNPNGSLFNLEPRTNAVVQVAQSVAFLPGKNNIDLVVGTATDARGLDTNVNATIISQDAFYVQRTNSNCAADFEGGVPGISNIIDTFVGFGSPVVVADPKRDQFYLVDLRFGLATDDGGVGIIRSTAADLLNPTACPNGTEVGTATCWSIGAVTNITPLNTFLSNPMIAVDQRATGKGAGDIYAVVTQTDSQNMNPHISLSACANDFNCGNSINISGTDTGTDFAWVQVLPEGDITVTYRNTTFPGINPEQIKFVHCTPNGAPATPTCNAPVLITNEKHPTFAAWIGDVDTTDVLYPKHVNRLEADGHTITTFLVYDRCEVALVGLIQQVCPKNDVVFTSSNDGGNTWAPITKVTNAKGQQFFGAIADDASTGTINIAYCSTENDPAQQRPQVFLAQILSGTTTIGGVHQLTTGFADVQASPPLSIDLQPTGFGNSIGIAAAGTGAIGHSRAYVSFTWNSVPGKYNGFSSPDVNNHIALFEY